MQVFELVGAVESGEHLGPHIWDEELLREARGEFMHTYVPSFQCL
jgi:hypothetical protein